MILQLKNLCKAYGELQVLKNLSLTLGSDRPYCLMAPSGSGKTTLFRILLGLEKPDSGALVMQDGTTLTAVFQEDRLCEAFTPIENIQLVTGRALPPGEIRAELMQLLPEESLTRPISTLSGGMKRRVAIARALLAPSDGIIMDEPFTGLDESTRQTVIDYILQKSTGKLLLISTHQVEDAKLLGAEVVHLG